MKQYKLIYTFISVVLICFSTALAAQNLVLQGQMSFGESAAGIWHYVDSLGNEYALVGLNSKVAVVDVTNPGVPVEKFDVPALAGQHSLWREVKTDGKYAYAVSEGGGGVIVIDLSHLPDTVYYHHWYGDAAINGLLSSGHAIAADNGYIYIFGSNIGVGGCLIADLNDPWNPHFTGQYNTAYVHDGYVRNDTLYAGEIYAGRFAIIDVTNKSNPVFIESVSTPGQFTHNTWLSDNGNYLYTTDEVSGAPLTAYDISDINNIEQVSTYFTDSLPGEEVHNVRVLNDFLINPSYGSQLTIVDGSRPDNLVEIAHAPTNNSGQPDLCWDASPFLPSGNIIVSDIEGGLSIFSCNYIHACYLEGVVTDSTTGLPINNVNIFISLANKTVKTNLAGEYKTGFADAGNYDVTISKAGYLPQTFLNVPMVNGQLTQLNAKLLAFTVEGQVTSALTGNGLNNIQVTISNGTVMSTVTTNSNGDFVFSNVESGIYTLSAGSWGYTTECVTQLLDGSAPVNLQLSAGIMDDFSTNNQWSVISSCSTGAWVRGIPIVTHYGVAVANPGNDVSNDCSHQCFVTGNGGGSATTDDVDNGSTTLTSPLFDLTGYSAPQVNYSRWFFINPNVTPSALDTLFIYLSNGISTVELENVTTNSAGNGTWVDQSFNINSFLSPTSTMSIIAVASDKTGSGNILEAGFDNFSITDGVSVKEESALSFSISPNPATNMIKINVDPSFITRETTLELTDLQGRICYTAPFTFTLQFPLNFTKGIYLLHIHNNSDQLNPVMLVKE
jgi:choice-of-anchor B domain-containing protein